MERMHTERGGGRGESIGQEGTWAVDVYKLEWNAPARDCLREDRCVGGGGLLQLVGKAGRVNR